MATAVSGAGNAAAPPLRGAGLIRQSRYIDMDDGVLLAIDVWRAAGEGDEGRPCLLLSTRYWRGFDLVEGDPELQPLYAMALHFTARGFVVAHLDSRGSGASFGVRETEWSPRERDDLHAGMDWIARQPWCDGNIFAHGYSYGGNTSFLAAAAGHPALKQILPQFADFDLYRHNLFPGGVPNIWLSHAWGVLTAAQDGCDLPALADAMPGVDRDAFLRLVRGPMPVDTDPHGQLLAEAIAGHAGNFGAGQTADRIVYVDDAARLNAGRSPHVVLDSETLSVWSMRERIEASNVPITCWAGWFDAGTAEGALELFRSFSNPLHVVIGPWSHGRRYLQDPFAGETPERIALAENFDDLIAAISTPPQTRTLSYYTLGANDWHHVAQWPPEGVANRVLYLSADGTLADVAPLAPDASQYRIDPATTTGRNNRWITQIGCMPVLHEDRRETDKALLVFDGAPLAQDTEITGTPSVALWMECEQPDAAVHVYLETITPDGRVLLLSEGMLRLIHRKTMPAGTHPCQSDPAHSFRREDGSAVVAGECMRVEIALLPLSVRLPVGHRVRLAIAGADADTFAFIGDVPATLRVHHGGDRVSTLSLPIMAGRDDNQ